MTLTNSDQILYDTWSLTTSNNYDYRVELSHFTLGLNDFYVLGLFLYPKCPSGLMRFVKYALHAN